MHAVPRMASKLAQGLHLPSTSAQSACPSAADNRGQRMAGHRMRQLQRDELTPDPSDSEARHSAHGASDGQSSSGGESTSGQPVNQGTDAVAENLAENVTENIHAAQAKVAQEREPRWRVILH